MVNIKLQELLNTQVVNELSAEMQYMAMSCWLEKENFSGMSKWFKRQAQEEHEHAMKIISHMHEWDIAVILKSPQNPKIDFKNLEEVFSLALENEKRVTSQINNIYKISHEESAWYIKIAFQWFITEQVEEEENARNNLSSIQRIGQDIAALMYFDEKLASVE